MTKSRRFFPAVRCALGLCLLASLSACSLFHRHHGSADATAQAGSGNGKRRANARKLDLEIRASPDPLKLGEVREIAVDITVRNATKQRVTLKFPTYQILEIVLRDVGTGAVVSKWSTDRTFPQDTRIVLINEGERLEYSEKITTRELKAGRPYNLEVFFLGYENELLAKKVLIPQP